MLDKQNKKCYNTYITNNKSSKERKRYQIMAEKKITKREVVEMMLAEEVITSNELFKKYLERELELLTNKSANRKATKTQTENEGIKDVILDVLGSTGPATATQIVLAMQKLDSEKYATLSNQKVSALLRQLIESELVRKTTEKKVSLFFLA